MDKKNESTSISGNEIASLSENEAENEAESPPFLSLMDLMLEIWDPSSVATRNIRSLIGVISMYMKTHENATPNARRVREGREMKRVLVDTHRAWIAKSPHEICSKRDLLTFVRFNVSKQLQARIMNDLMNEETFNEWMDECKGHAIGTIDRGARNESEELDELFESTPEQNPEMIAQNMTKLDNGRLLTVKTPGEIGDQMIRVYVYDTIDIMNKEKRHWWKYAKLRTQFLSSSAKTDDVQQLLNQLFGVVARRLAKIPGVVKETMNVVDDSVSRQCSSASVKRKRNDGADDDDILEPI